MARHWNGHPARRGQPVTRIVCVSYRFVERSRRERGAAFLCKRAARSRRFNPKSAAPKEIAATVRPESLVR